MEKSTCIFQSIKLGSNHPTTRNIQLSKVKKQILLFIKLSIVLTRLQQMQSGNGSELGTALGMGFSSRVTHKTYLWAELGPKTPNFQVRPGSSLNSYQLLQSHV